MSTFSNTAAYLLTPQSPLTIRPAPYTTPGPDQIVIKSRALAINPIDWLVQTIGTARIFPWLKYPLVLGTDVSGEVVQVGTNVRRFKIGDRVVGCAAGLDERRFRNAEAAFQDYVILLDYMTSPIPDGMKYEEAAVIPLGFSTASCGSFQKDMLALRSPSSPPISSTPRETLLIWGGSTSVGSNAIQLAVAAGYEVISTSSAKNFDYVKSLGASHVFDYNSKTVVNDIVQVFNGKTSAGALAIGQTSGSACMDIIAQVPGKKFVAMASYPIPNPPPSSIFTVLYILLSTAASNWYKSNFYGIGYKMIFGSTLIHNGVGKMVYEDYLSVALMNGDFKARPEPIVVGKGLESLQKAFDVQKKGVSAGKVVVAL